MPVIELHNWSSITGISTFYSIINQLVKPLENSGNALTTTYAS